MLIMNKQEKFLKEIDIVAPKDVTAINSIKDLDVETVGEKATTDVSLERGKSSKKLELISKLLIIMKKY